MSEAPKRIRATEGYADVGRGAWDSAEMGDDTEYVRADIADDMLAALKAADAHFTGTFSENGTDHQQIRAAIVKAEAQSDV